MPRVSHAAVAGLSFAGVVAAAGAAIWGWDWKGAPTVLGGMVATDHYASFFRFVLLGVAVTCLGFQGGPPYWTFAILPRRSRVKMYVTYSTSERLAGPRDATT